MGAPSPGDAAPGSAEPVTLHSSWWGIVTAFATPLLLVLIGGGTLAARGFHVVPAVILAVGVGLGAVALADFPVSCRFDGDGVERRCPLRRERLAWPSVDSIQRASGSRVRRLRAADGDGRRRVPSPGGLVARVGRRRYLLVDQPESAGEWEAVVGVVAASAPDVAVAAARPPAGVPPTWLYRRGRRR